MIPSLLYNQLSTQSGIVAILEFDPTIFDDLVFPEGVDKQIFVDSLVQTCGHTPLLHPDPGYLHYYIPAWGKRTFKIWQKLAATLDLEYNPIENYDRNSTYTDTTDRSLNRTTSNSTESHGTNDSSGNNSNTSEDKVSADNSSEYQPDHTSTASGTTSDLLTMDSSGSDSGKMTDAENVTHTYTERTHGNVGVTTSQQMVQSERDLVRYDFYMEIVNSFKREFCLLVY